MSVLTHKKVNVKPLHLKYYVDIVTKNLEYQSEFTLGILGVSIVIILGIIDYATGYDLSFSLFYLAPISLVSWFGKRRLGVLISLVSALTWFTADIANGRIYTYPIIYLWNTLIRLGFFIIVTFLLSALKRILKEEQEMARIDFLTHSINTRYFYDLGQLEINRSLRYHNPFTIVYIDLDNFKTINDEYGHSTGDLLLQKVAKIIQENIRNTDQVGRLGGDEFAVLLPETGTEWAHQIVNRINLVLNDEMAANNWIVSFSIGVAIFNSPPLTMDEAIKIADDEMYKIKSNQKNGISYIEI